MNLKFNFSSNTNLQSDFIHLQDENWLQRQRIAGKVAAGALNLLEKYCIDKTRLSLKELDLIAHQFIIDNECSPTFYGYRGFPNAVCISVNKGLVHGIPSDYKLQEGDVVKFDLGATFEGAIADSAITCIFGEPKSKSHIELVQDTQTALYNGIRSIQVGKKIGVIGNAVFKTIKDKYDVVVNYGGHGLEYDRPHAQPFIPNKSLPTDGVRIQPNLTIAIEPMAVIKSTNFFTKIAEDEWLINTNDIGSHWEHTVFIHNDRVEVITIRDGENI